MFNDEGIVSVGDLLESLGLKHKSTEMGGARATGPKPRARDGLFPPYFSSRGPRRRSGQPRRGRAPRDRRHGPCRGKLVEKVGVSFSHAGDRRGSPPGRRSNVIGGGQGQEVESTSSSSSTLDGMADFAKDFVRRQYGRRRRRRRTGEARSAAAARGGVGPSGPTGTSRGAGGDREGEGHQNRAGGAEQVRGRIYPRVSGRSRRCTTFTWARRTSVAAHSYVRHKAARVLVGAGYTSMFILQALRDNAAELDAYEELRGGSLQVRRRPWAWMTFSSGGNRGEVHGDPCLEKTSRRASRVSRRSDVDGGSLDDEDSSRAATVRVRSG